MAQRRHHYERAFEDYLRRTRAPYVAVNEAKKALLPAKAPLRLRRSGMVGVGPTLGEPQSLKSLDFVVYGEGSNLLVEIKGRKLPRRRSGPSRRLECWVQSEDVRSLRAWAGLFGPGFEAVFVFVYWCDDQPPDGLFQEVFASRGRWYAVRAVALDDYEAYMRTRSPRWGTVDLPAEVYERVSRPFRPSVWECMADAGTPEPGPMHAPSQEQTRGQIPTDAGPMPPVFEPLGVSYPV